MIIFVDFSISPFSAQFSEHFLRRIFATQKTFENGRLDFQGFVEFLVATEFRKVYTLVVLWKFLPSYIIYFFYDPSIFQKRNLSASSRYLFYYHKINQTAVIIFLFQSKSSMRYVFECLNLDGDGFLKDSDLQVAVEASRIEVL